MMERRTFMESMLALFCGAVIPLPIREAATVWTTPTRVSTVGYAVGASSAGDLQEMWREIQVAVVQSATYPVGEMAIIGGGSLSGIYSAREITFDVATT